MEDERPDDCLFRITSATGTSFAVGSILGAVTANWSDVPVVLKSKSLPALARTGSVMMAYGTTYAFIGFAFSGVDCLAETIRGKKDMWNGALGGAAAGAVLGLRVGRLPLGLGAAAALAATSMLVDTSGQSLRGHGMVDDGATPPRRLFPYPSRNENQQ